MQYLSEGRAIQSISVEVPLESEEGECLHTDINISCHDITLEELLTEDCTTSFSKASPRTGVSLTQVLSYLSAEIYSAHNKSTQLP